MRKSSLDQCAKMEDPLENLISYMEMEDDVLNQSNGSFDEEEFLKDIILQGPDFSSPECKPSPYPPACSKIQNNTSSTADQEGINVEGGATCSPTNSTLSFDETSFDHDGNNNNNNEYSTTLHKSNSSNSIMSLERCNQYSPATYILSFDKSSVEQISPEPGSSHDLPLGSKRSTIDQKDGFEFEPIRVVHQATKKGRRRSSETQEHIMAERKRRRELTQSVIALSATIPGLKKMDKAYVLREAVNYMKQLQERVKELENKKNKRVKSAIFIGKSQASSNKSTTYCETITESPLEVEARVLQKEVLIRIHCGKQKDDIVLKIHLLLEKLHLSITSSSALPFGTSTLIINIIAQMDDEHIMTMDDLVKNLKKYLLETWRHMK